MRKLSLSHNNAVVNTIFLFFYDFCTNSLAFCVSSWYYIEKGGGEVSKLQERIKERRLSLNLTLAEIADLLNVKEATVQRYESGEIKNIKHGTIFELSKILKCDPSYLMGWSDDLIASVNNASLTSHENKVLTAYRNKPHMQPAVDKILDIKDDVSLTTSDEDEENKYIKFVAARSKDGQSQMRIEKGNKEQYEDLLNAPKSKMDL